MKNKRGMTLVEVLVASVIVGIIAVGTLGIFVVAKRATCKTGDKIVALGDTRTVILEKVAKKGYNFADIKQKAMTDYKGLNTMGVPASFPGSNLPSSQDEKYQITKSETWDAVTTGVCNTPAAGESGAYINYCYKPIEFEVSWTKRE